MFRILAILLVSFGCLLPAAAEVKVQKTDTKDGKTAIGSATVRLN